MSLNLNISTTWVNSEMYPVPLLLLSSLWFTAAALVLLLHTMHKIL